MEKGRSDRRGRWNYYYSQWRSFLFDLTHCRVIFLKRLHTNLASFPGLPLWPGLPYYTDFPLPPRPPVGRLMKCWHHLNSSEDWTHEVRQCASVSYSIKIPYQQMMVHLTPCVLNTCVAGMAEMDGVNLWDVTWHIHAKDLCNLCLVFCYKMLSLSPLGVIKPLLPQTLRAFLTSLVWNSILEVNI
jgi:hypothetical protein